MSTKHVNYFSRLWINALCSIIKRKQNIDNAKQTRSMYDLTIRIVVEVASAILCFILLRFMIKPYRLTGESRYLGLPLGFAFLGISYILGAIALSQIYSSYGELAWLPLLARTFAFSFLVVTYYFSKEPARNSRILWDITLGLLVTVLIASVAAVFMFPQVAASSYMPTQQYLRIFNIICLVYISIYTLRSHIRKPDPTTIWIPFGFILLGISQYSFLIWAIDASNFAFTGALLIRLASLVVFLIVSYRTFYSSSKKVD